MGQPLATFDPFGISKGELGTAVASMWNGTWLHAGLKRPYVESSTHMRMALRADPACCHSYAYLAEMTSAVRAFRQIWVAGFWEVVY